ncbi:hypothetical protein K501DRAFT_50950 [Backusella circina FSU 941]|nr:hypothetical protein K501DRAFT_50950 [Backusella circina FSU 941]
MSIDYVDSSLMTCLENSFYLAALNCLCITLSFYARVSSFCIHCLFQENEKKFQINEKRLMTRKLRGLKGAKFMIQLKE